MCRHRSGRWTVRRVRHGRVTRSKWHRIKLSRRGELFPTKSVSVNCCNEGLGRRKDQVGVTLIVNWDIFIILVVRFIILLTLDSPFWMQDGSNNEMRHWQLQSSTQVRDAYIITRQQESTWTHTPALFLLMHSHGKSFANLFDFPHLAYLSSDNYPRSGCCLRRN